MKDFLDGIAYHAVRMLAIFIRKLSLEQASRFGKVSGRIIFYFSGRRHVAYADIKAALGNQYSEKERWKIIRKHYEHLGQMFVEVLRFPMLDRQSVKQILSIDDSKTSEKIERDQRGVIFLTGHFGNWELSQVAYGILRKRIHVLAREQKHGRLNQFLNELRESHGSVAKSRGMGIRSILQSLRRRELIGVLGDQDNGKSGGIILPFFDRKTTVPTGAFDLAMRTGVPVLPCFIVRAEGPRHVLHFCEAIECSQDAADPKAEIEKAARAYLKILEDFIRRFPSQWLWESKRWKYSWTKRILILSDGKPGHQKQSEALAAQFETLKTQYGRPGLECPVKILQVRFKSEWRRKIFPWFALFFIPRAQGRLRQLGFFFTPETQKTILESSADFVISAGSSLVPLNLCLAHDSRAKSIVLMKPSFPFNFFRYDLAVIPYHDQGMVPKNTLRTLLTPSRMEPEELAALKEKFQRNLRDPSQVKFAVFLGGPTRRFKMELSDIEKVFSSLSKIAKSCGDYVVTTSRRTPEFISRFLKQKVAHDASCQMLVIANENNRPEIAGGMMALADVLIITEDSISMISEGVSAGKKVIVLSLGSEGLPEKHRRFREILARESAVVIASPEDLENKLMSLDGQIKTDVARTENEILQKKLQEIL